VNISPVFVLEYLNRITVLLKDYLGNLSEESVRKNFLLVYEIIDEIADYGIVQNTTTGGLKLFVFNDPIEIESQEQGILSQLLPVKFQVFKQE